MLSCVEKERRVCGKRHRTVLVVVVVESCAYG